MDNQHRKITGYRDLNADEISLMNEIKEHGEATKRLIHKINSAHEFEHPVGHETTEGQFEEMQRCRDIATTKFQEGLMWLVRAVAKPSTF